MELKYGRTFILNPTNKWIEAQTLICLFLLQLLIIQSCSMNKNLNNQKGIYI